MKKLLKAVSRKILNTAAARPSSQKWVLAFQREVQLALGFGGGADTASSGEEQVFDLVRARHQSSSSIVIFDVGANTGQFLSMALKKLGDLSPSIHCFEPSSVCATELRTKFGKLPNVSLNKFGLGKTEGDFMLYADHAGSAFGSLSKRDIAHYDIHFEHSEHVEISTVDLYCQKALVSRIDWLKIDVEGHDLDVLQGAHQMLSGYTIQFITFEFGGGNIDTRSFLRDFFKLFALYPRYALYRILPTGHYLALSRYEENLEQFTNSNYLASLDGIRL